MAFFSKEVRSLFQSSVHPFIGSAHFTMVVSFGRASFRLDEDMVSLALEAAIGAHSVILRYRWYVIGFFPSLRLPRLLVLIFLN
jgi:hypothetical protein